MLKKILKEIKHFIKISIIFHKTSRTYKKRNWFFYVYYPIAYAKFIYYFYTDKS